MKRQAISTTRLAEICGVSQGTVDRALNGRGGISQKTKERILAAAKAYGYRPNPHASSIGGGKSMLIGIVVFDLYNAYFPELLSKIEEECAARGYYAIVMLTHKDRERELECIKSLYHMSVDGIVLCPINKGEDFENFLLSLDTPAIAVNNRLERIAYIGIDNRGAMRDSAEHCIKEGYEKLIYVMPKLKDGDNAHAQEQRLLGFQDAVTAADIPHVITHVDEVDSSIDDRQRVAVVCASDFYAQKLYQKYKGKNVGIIGFDDQRTLRELGIAMDSVAYDVSATAKSAIAYLLDGIKPTQPIPHRIVKRGSV